MNLVKYTIVIKTISLFLVIALTSSACTASNGAEIPDMTEEVELALPNTIKIGAVIPITGRYAPGGNQIKTGYELAVEDINQAGGINIQGAKIPLELITLDDESDPTKTVQRMETLYSKDILVYVGGFGSDLHIAAAGIAEKNKVPYLGVAFAILAPHEQGYKYLFSPFPKSPLFASSTFDLFDSLNPRPSNIAVFSETTDWGNELSTYWQREAEMRGYGITIFEYAPGSTDFSNIIIPARDSGVDAVLALPNPPDALTLAKQMKELDFNANAYVFIRGADSPTFGENLGVDSDGFFLMSGWNNAVEFEGVADMAERYQTKFDTPAAATTGPAYAVIQIIADAISRANSMNPEAIRNAIAETNMNTVIGNVTFNENGTGNVINLINQWQSGTQVLVWPPDQAVGELIYPAIPWAIR